MPVDTVHVGRVDAHVGAQDGAGVAAGRSVADRGAQDAVAVVGRRRDEVVERAALQRAPVQRRVRVVHARQGAVARLARRDHHVELEPAAHFGQLLAALLVAVHAGGAWFVAAHLGLDAGGPQRGQEDAFEVAEALGAMLGHGGELAADGIPCLAGVDVRQARVAEVVAELPHAKHLGERQEDGIVGTAQVPGGVVLERVDGPHARHVRGQDHERDLDVGVGLDEERPQDGGLLAPPVDVGGRPAVGDAIQRRAGLRQHPHARGAIAEAAEQLGGLGGRDGAQHGRREHGGRQPPLGQDSQPCVEMPAVNDRGGNGVAVDEPAAVLHRGSAAHRKMVEGRKPRVRVGHWRSGAAMGACKVRGGNCVILPQTRPDCPLRFCHAY